jgi:hypothetical protein
MMKAGKNSYQKGWNLGNFIILDNGKLEYKLPADAIKFSDLL